MESECGKLFVGGVSQETTGEILKEHFCKYGDVKGSEIIRDRISGNGRGFGFVTFDDSSVVDKVLEDKHVILGRMVEVKLAKPKGAKYQKNNGSGGNNGYEDNGCVPPTENKIFVGGLPLSLTEEEFKEYFESFGAIKDGVVIYDKENNRSRGFGFITFETKEAMDKALEQKFHELNNKLVEVKRAEPKDCCMSSRYMYTYDCYNRGLDFEGFSISGSYPYGRVSGYTGGNLYEAGFLTGPYIGSTYPTFSDATIGNYYYTPVLDPRYINGGNYINGGLYNNGFISGWANGPVAVSALAIGGGDATLNNMNNGSGGAPCKSS